MWDLAIYTCIRATVGQRPAERSCNLRPSTIAVRTDTAESSDARCRAGATGCCAASARSNVPIPRCHGLLIGSSLCGRNARSDPRIDVRNDDVLVEIVEQVVDVAVVQLQRLIGRSGGVVEELAAG